jgi:hypothetical protein
MNRPPLWQFLIAMFSVALLYVGIYQWRCRKWRKAHALKVDGQPEKSIAILEAERSARGFDPAQIPNYRTSDDFDGNPPFPWSLDGIGRPGGRAVYMEEMVSRKVRMQYPDWKRVVHLGSVKLWEAVALSLAIDPACLGQFDVCIYSTMQERDCKRLEHRLRLAESHLHTSLPVEILVENLGRKYESTVSLRKFVKWAVHAMPWELPDEFRALEVGEPA